MDDWKLQTTKPKSLEFKGKQICLRCGKNPAEEGDYYCLKCLQDRTDIDEMIKLRNKDKPKPLKEDEEEKDIDDE